jgi:hypothetical protein
MRETPVQTVCERAERELSMEAAASASAGFSSTQPSHTTTVSAPEGQYGGKG